MQYRYCNIQTQQCEDSSCSNGCLLMKAAKNDKTEYRFDLFPGILCKCGYHIHKGNLIRFGKYGFCFHCHKRVYTAPKEVKFIPLREKKVRTGLPKIEKIRVERVKYTPVTPIKLSIRVGSIRVK